MPDRSLRMLLPDAPWTRALAEGSVQVDGLQWQCHLDSAHAPERFVAAAEQHVDVGEAGLRRHILDVQRGAPKRAMPAFLGRELMQRNILVPRDSPLTHPGDLAGKRIGSWMTIVSGTNAAVLMMLEQAYGVELHDIEWHMHSNQGLPVNRMDLNIVTDVPSQENCLERIRNGEFDAMLLTLGPRYWSLFGHERERLPGLRPLIADPQDIAAAYRRTGLYPITDVVVLAPGLAEERPDVPDKVMAALRQANQLASHYRPAEEERLARRELELLGDDPHQYELGPNQRHNLAALIDFFYRLGALEQPIELEELFLRT